MSVWSWVLLIILSGVAWIGALIAVVSLLFWLFFRLLGGDW